MLNELACSECSTAFPSAASLLKHFAQHASRDIQQSSETRASKKATIPDLYPISSLKLVATQSKAFCDDLEDNADSGVEDLANCLRYSAGKPDDHNEFDYVRTSRKYKCAHCWKSFGWSTDLKRHTLTHTGERPFRCDTCDTGFTRKFLLQKHEAKQHGVAYASRDEIEIPPLKPIGFLLRRKSRKQDKQKIKRNVLNAKSPHQGFEVSNLVCSM